MGGIGEAVGWIEQAKLKKREEGEGQKWQFWVDGLFHCPQIQPIISKLDRGVFFLCYFEHYEVRKHFL